jgi:hypothetical protein
VTSFPRRRFWRPDSYESATIDGHANHIEDPSDSYVHLRRALSSHLRDACDLVELSQPGLARRALEMAVCIEAEMESDEERMG